ncbi:hypothetical protein Trydic_g15547 [Trypoxylus dichotomus]
MIMNVGQRDERGGKAGRVVIELIGEKFKPLKRQLSAQPSVLNRNNGNYFHIAVDRREKEKTIKGYPFLLSVVRDHSLAFSAKNVYDGVLCVGVGKNQKYNVGRILYFPAAIFNCLMPE